MGQPYKPAELRLPHVPTGLGCLVTVHHSLYGDGGEGNQGSTEAGKVRRPWSERGQSPAEEGELTKTGRAGRAGRKEPVA